MREDLIELAKQQAAEIARAGHNGWGNTMLALAATLESSAPVEVEAYNRKQIAWELERTAMGDGFYGNALRVAKDFPEATPEARSLLDRWATGSQRGLSDRTELCSFALTVALAQQPAADPRSTHRVWRENDWLSCYCAAASDHHIGNEQPAAVDEATRRDAERYRWLRGLDGSCDSAACVNFNIGFDWIEAHGVELDDAIDAAMNGANTRHKPRGEAASA